jgi:hypothetical protein
VRTGWVSAGTIDDTTRIAIDPAFCDRSAAALRYRVLDFCRAWRPTTRSGGS